MKNKENIIIGGLLVAIIGVIALLLFGSSNSSFKLNGDKKMTIEYGAVFIDPGVTAYDEKGNDVKSSVTIKGNIDTFKVGIQQIVYELNIDNKKKILIRTVVVKGPSSDELKIVLNGESTIYLLKNSSYVDPGAYVVNTINGEKFDLGKMQITNNIDIKNSGNYEVNYRYTYDGKTISKVRKVIVSDINYVVTPSSLTEGSVNISFDFRNVNNYSNIELPDGKILTDKQVNYKVSVNGNYTFLITFKDGETVEKVISINNVVSNYKCSGEITSNGTKITVSPSANNVKNYEWIINNKTVNGTSIYNEYKIITSAKVNIVFENGQKHKVDCSIKDKLLYHFTYDLDNTGTWVKPEMKCDSYTAADRTRLEKQLKQAIDEAGGAGTRGGVVAAARFLVGALDYRVRYQGPKTSSTQVGKYAKIGLNIGNSKAWGCRVDGYTQGMDCTHFIEWVLYQNGFTKHPYYYTQTETSKVIDKIKPGDLLYVKSSSGSLSHVGIVAGVDREKQIYYIAESVPGNDGKLGVTLHATKRSTVLGAYKAVGNIPFKGEGNVNDMWLTK